MPIEQPSPTRWYWYAGHLLDLVHMPFVLALLVFGKPVLNTTVFTAVVTVIVVFQVATLGCPCVAVSAALKRRHDPTYRSRWSFTAWLYNRYGPVVAIPIFVALMAAGFALARVVT